MREHVCIACFGYLQYRRCCSYFTSAKMQRAQRHKQGSTICKVQNFIIFSLFQELLIFQKMYMMFKNLIFLLMKYNKWFMIFRKMFNILKNCSICSKIGSWISKIGSWCSKVVHSFFKMFMIFKNLSVYSKSCSWFLNFGHEFLFMIFEF
jgi:hypothetical protein